MKCCFSRLLFLTLMGFCQPLVYSSDQRPDLIVLITADDLRPALGSYGDEWAQTPHIDALAARSVRFDQAHVQQAVCAPSRMSMLSGLRPETLQVFGLSKRFRDVDQKTLSLPGFLKENGYFSVSLGKLYHHDDDDLESFDLIERRYVDRYLDPENIAIHGGQPRKRTKPWHTRDLYRARAWENPDVLDEAYEDHEMTTRAIDLLETTPRDQPLFLAVGYRRPHLPFNAPKKYWDLFAETDFSVAVNRKPQGTPQWAMSNWGELRGYHGIPAQGDLESAQAQQIARAYYACVAYIDAQIGRLMQAIDARAEKENVVILFWGDHGYKLGEYGDWSKHTNLHIDTRVPLLIQAPQIEPGVHFGAVEILDVYPTVADLIGLDVPSHCEGRSLRLALENPQPIVEEPSYALSVYPKKGALGYSITDGNWRFTAWYKKGKKALQAIELYDHRDSSVATENVANDERFAAHQQRLQQALQQRVPHLPQLIR